MRREIDNDNRKAKTQWYEAEKGWFVFILHDCGWVSQWILILLLRFGWFPCPERLNTKTAVKGHL